MEEKCVAVCVSLYACVYYVIWQEGGVPLVLGERLDIRVLVWTHNTPAASAAEHRPRHTHQHKHNVHVRARTTDGAQCRLPRK